AIAYDPTIQAVVLFGGYDPSLAAVGDTWTFSNNTWTQISSNLTVAPPARWGATMVWDAADGYLLLFGGRNTGAYFNDTWTFNGTAWSNVASSVAPPPRSLFEMAYDPADREVIVDGGARLNFSSGAWGTVNDTWAYAAGTWTNISSAAPGGALDRAAGQASYDPWNGSVVFVGGGSTVNWTFGCTPIDPVQTYVNRSWYEYPSSVGPPQISQTMMTYDPAGPYLFLFGGFEPSGTGSYASCIQTNATWVRSAGVWYNLTGSLSASPGLRYLSGIAFDPVLDEVLLFGGNGNNAYLGDTWVYRIPSLDTILQASRIYGITPLSVRFFASTVGGLAASGWNWSFGDGTTSTIGPSVNHTYASVGVYNASVNVTGSAGGYFVTNVTIDVAPILQAMGSASRTLGSVPFAVTFNGSASGGFAPYRYNWTFGDGGRAAVANVTHTYTTPGNFTAQLRVVDHEGDTNASSVRLDVGPQLVTTAVASVRRGVTPLWVNFTSTTTGGTGSDTYLWTFGDGSFSSLPDPTHEYLRTGNFTVVLNATDSLARTATSSIPLVVLPALAASVETAATTGVAPFSLTFVAVVNGGDAPYTDTWNFGDGTPATTGISVGHTFVNAGSFLVELSVGDALGDAARAVETVNVVAPLSAKHAASVAT
ncbi:MAG: PKD domain-containing protein, partial [Thermoplasmata archaeon]|nr:PKD domain-containing protein [Thermoplasmata archaeon]